MCTAGSSCRYSTESETESSSRVPQGTSGSGQNEGSSKISCVVAWVKPGSQYDAGASVISGTSLWPTLE